jgi:peptidoglycan/LPS O-acetylase OafA/YrhL
MTSRFSLYLDAVRFGAAMLVLLSHFAYPRFSEGDWLFIRTLNLGSDAVVLFFVLSGFVIAFVAEQRDREAATFFFNRATRLYSVLLPAMLLTVVCDTIGRAAAPEMYDGMWWYNAEPIWRQVAAVVSFTHEGWGSGVRFGTNGPLWSLGYEAWYYALFGALFFLRGSQRVVVAVVIAVLAGPRVLALLPAWWAGVMLWRRLSDDAPVSRRNALILCIVPIALYAVWLASSVPETLKVLTAVVLGADTVNWLRFSDEFVWNALIGLMVAVHFFGVWHLCRASVREPGERFTRSVRWLAGATFSIYVVHYPVLQMLDGLLPEGMAMRQGVLLALVLLACFAFAELFERRLELFRRIVSRVTPSLAPAR